jgi:hypothetical protein
MEPALKTFLICCYPRSRSLWLSRFLTVPGLCVCEHEASEFAASSKEFWDRAEIVAADQPFYGNADSAALFVLPALLAANPLAKVVWIERPMCEVISSTRKAGFTFTDEQACYLVQLRQKYDAFIDVSLNYRALGEVAYVRWLWQYLFSDVSFDLGRWCQHKDWRIAYTAATLPKRDTARFRQFLINETEHMRRCHAEGG